MSKNQRDRRRPGGRGGKDSERARPADEGAQARDPRIDELLRSKDLLERAMKHADSPALRQELEQLGPDEAAMFVLLVEKQLARRRLELLGHALALLGLLGGMLLALYLYATREPGEFMGWAFLIPFLLAGAVFVIFGRLARRQ